MASKNLPPPAKKSEKLSVEASEDLISPYDLDAYAKQLGEDDNATEAAINEAEGPTPVQLFRDLDTDEIESKLKDVAESGDNSISEEERLLKRMSTKAAVYGQPIDESTAADLTDGTGGQIWRAKIYRTGFVDKKVCIKNKDTGEYTIKPRRPIPCVYEDDFFNSLTKVKGKYVFQGRLNGWPGLSNLELLSLEYWYTKQVGPKLVQFSKTFWSKKDSFGKTEPKYPGPGLFFFNAKPNSIRATLRAPKYTDIGYSKDNRGFVFWFQQFAQPPRMIHGEKMIEKIRESTVPKMVKAHFYGHRYAKLKESAKDKILYHTGVLIEWDHGEYCTNVELAYLFGIGGYMGRSNWLDDRDAPKPLLYQTMPDDLKAPWNSSRNEIRMIDMPCKNVDGFMGFLKSHEGPTGRFLNPSIKHSGDVRLSFNGADDLVRYLINYSVRDTSYSEEFHNCQSFAADFFGFLCAKPQSEPFYPVKLLYTERRHLFLYEPTMFERKPASAMRPQALVNQLRRKKALEADKEKEKKKEKADRNASGNFFTSLFGQ